MNPFFAVVARAFIAVCFFILGRWLIPVLFALVSVVLPNEIVVVLSILIAVGVFFGSAVYVGA